MKLFRIGENFAPDVVDEVSSKLLNFEVGVLPTDTIYGLSGILHPMVVSRISKMKKRSENKQFVLLADRNILNDICILSPDVEKVIEWGDGKSVSFIVKAKNIPVNWDTIAVRLTGHPFVKEILAKVKQPIISTSANISGQEPLTSVKDIVRLFGEQIDFAVADEELEVSIQSLPSTIVDLTQKPFKVLRHGREMVPCDFLI